MGNKRLRGGHPKGTIHSQNEVAATYAAKKTGAGNKRCLDKVDPQSKDQTTTPPQKTYGGNKRKQYKVLYQLSYARLSPTGGTRTRDHLITSRSNRFLRRSKT